MNQTYYKNLNKKKLFHYGIVCNDAGGANIIFNTLKNIKYKKISICATGPAIKIYKQFFPNIKNFNNLSKIFKDSKKNICKEVKYVLNPAMSLVTFCKISSDLFSRKKI